MRLGIFSDTHLGFAEKEERSDDSFLALDQAIGICGAAGVDLIVLSGDVFDTTVPSHTVLFRAVNSFARAKEFKSGVKLKLEKNSSSGELKFSGIPILAIHGNHEYLGKEQRTALDVLSASGLIIYFHAGKIVAQKGEECTCIFGLGAVPEKVALDVLRQWNPQAQSGACNILLTHQGFKEFMPIEDDMVASLSLGDLPKGFDLVVNGHLHWSSLHEISGSKFLLAGSTIPTSIKKLEAERQKGVYIFDTQTKSLEFFPFERQREMFYHKILFNDADSEKIRSECAKTLEGDLKGVHEFKPLIRLNLKGSLKKGLSNSDIDISEIEAEYSAKAILSISKDFSSDSFKKKISELREMQKSKLSVISMGMQILEKNLSETGFGSDFDMKKFFDLLSNGEIEQAEKMVVLR